MSAIKDHKKSFNYHSNKKYFKKNKDKMNQNKIFKKNFTNESQEENSNQSLISDCKQQEPTSKGSISIDEAMRTYFDFFQNMYYEYENILNDHRIHSNIRETILSMKNWLTKIINTFSSININLMGQYYMKFTYYHKILSSDIHDVLSKKKMNSILDYSLLFNPYDFNEKWFLPNDLLS